MTTLSRRLCLTFALPALVLLPRPCRAQVDPFTRDHKCPPEKHSTLFQDFRRASLVVLGRFVQQGDPASADAYDFAIDRIFKSHDSIKEKKVIALPREAAPGKGQFIAFIDFDKGQLYPWRGLQIPPGSGLVDYFTRLVQLKDRPAPERLRCCFDYLDSAEDAIAYDSRHEITHSEYKEFREFAKALPAEKIAARLRDSKTLGPPVGLYASMLGHCGDPAKHGTLLRRLCDDVDKSTECVADCDVLTGYVVLQPKEGWNYVRDILEGGSGVVRLRYSALRVARLLYAERSDLVLRSDVAGALVPVLRDEDMADFAIEDLRRWKRWELADKRLRAGELAAENGPPAVHRAALRFALQCPEAAAAEFVRRLRRSDPKLVGDIEEGLRLEAEETLPHR